MAASSINAPLDFVIKAASRCNLNCSYCYVYNKEDQSWRGQPVMMTAATFERAVGRIRDYCALSRQSEVRITFHGGEPTLIGAARFAQWCTDVRAALEPAHAVRLSLQTNGTLLTDEWARVLVDQGVDVGISLDGPADVNDRQRVDRAGVGSYAAVLRGIECLTRNKLEIHLLTVIQPGADSLRIHRHLRDCGARTISYLLPDYTHDTIGPVREAFGDTPCADYLLPIFQEELATFGADPAANIVVPLMRTLMKLVMGGSSDSDVFGNQPLSFVFINTDGGIELLDVLRACAEGMVSTGLNVHRDAIASLASRSAFHREVVFEGVALSVACSQCSEKLLCGGGYLPHRYAASNKFDNRSIWCADILALLSYIRATLAVDRDQTELRREALQWLRNKTFTSEVSYGY